MVEYNNKSSNSEISTSSFISLKKRDVKKKFHNIIHELRHQKGGNVLVVVSSKSSCIFQLELTKYLLNTELIDGVMVCFARSYKYIHRLLTRHSKSLKKPYYIDSITSAFAFNEDKNDDRLNDAVIFKVKNTFEYDKIYDAIAIAVNKKAMEKKGDEFFIIVDDISSLIPGMSINDIGILGNNVFDGFKGSFVYKFIIITKSNSADFQHIFKALDRNFTTLIEIR